MHTLNPVIEVYRKLKEGDKMTINKNQKADWTRSREEIIAKINEYLKLPIEKQLDPRNLGFYDALHWVVDDIEQEVPISCLCCIYSGCLENGIFYCKKLNMPIPGDMLNNRPCWCPFNKEKKDDNR